MDFFIGHQLYDQFHSCTAVSLSADSKKNLNEHGIFLMSDWKNCEIKCKQRIHIMFFSSVIPSTIRVNCEDRNSSTHTHTHTHTHTLHIHV